MIISFPNIERTYHFHSILQSINKIVLEQCDVQSLKCYKNLWADYHFCHPEILHFLMADISLCIAHKKLKIALKSDKLKLCQPFEIISDLV